MTDTKMFQLTIKNAKLWYQSGNEMYKNRLLDYYDDLPEAKQQEADKIIIKFLPIWADA